MCILWDCIFRDGECWVLLVLQDIEVDVVVGVDVGVIDVGGEVDFWGFEWVVGWEMNSEEEDIIRVWRVILIFCQ